MTGCWKLHGDITRPSTIMLAQEDYRRGLFANEEFQAFFRTILLTRTVVFLGCSLTDYDLKLILEELNFRHKHGLPTHYALMQTRGMNPVLRQNFYRSYGIQVIGDDERDGFPDIEAFLRALPGVAAPTAPRPPVPQPRRWGNASWMKSPANIICFLGEYKAGAEIRRFATCYVSGDARPQAAERLAGSLEGVLIASSSIPESVPAGVRAYTRAQFIDRLADFDPYLNKLKAEYEKDEIDRYFVPLKIQQEKKGKIAETPVPLDAFFDAWLAAEGRNHLSLLGDFGTGKTWFCRRMAHRAALNGGRVPVLILLRDYSKACNIEQVLTDARVNHFGVSLAAGFKTLERLNLEGRRRAAAMWISRCGT